MLSALRRVDQIVLGRLMVDKESNEIPAAPELIEALGLKGCHFTLDAEHCQKRFARVIVSGNRRRQPQRVSIAIPFKFRCEE